MINHIAETFVKKPSEVNVEARLQQLILEIKNDIEGVKKRIQGCSHEELLQLSELWTVGQPSEVSPDQLTEKVSLLTVDPADRESASTDSDFLDQCEILSTVIFNALKSLSKDIYSQLILNRRASHTYLRLFVSGQEIIIEPSIGQYVRNHQYVFIGTKESFIKFVTTSYSSGQLDLSVPTQEDVGSLPKILDLKIVLFELWGIET